ncbi:hypothetical protein NDU88_002742 [Pleurodeles waltl]|uniref:Uncharacterized protein n=1 Tax=Pleurodeles waltl TaxID=8319 RepID=A0AAV7SF03_PLEWA|nr:hypothetical protein NDU88_002742 [Pleurodeles waltl]
MGRAATPASYYSVSVLIEGRPQHCQGPRPRSGAVPLRRLTGRIFTSLDLGPWGPTSTSAAAGRLVWSPPPFSGRQPPSLDRSRLNSRPRLQPHDQAASPRPRGQARSARQCPLGSPQGPIMPGARRRNNSSDRTPIGPETACFFTISRRPLRSEKIRRAPSPDPWPRPKVRGSPGSKSVTLNQP